MAWPKGKPHPGVGRKPGSKNKKTDLFARCEEHGIDVFDELLLSAARELDPDKRFFKFKEIAPYLYAKKKEVLTLSEIPVEELLKAAEEGLTDDSAKEA